MNTNAAGGFPHVILASASPRRLDLLRQAGIEPEVEPSHVVEVIRSTKPDEVVMELSRQKAEDIASRHTGEDVVVIGADTVVAFDGNILGPKILGNSTGLSSFWVLFSILFFGGLFGFVGMIIAVPAFAVIYDLISRAVHRSLRLRKLPMETDEYRKLDHIDEKTGMFMELNKK